jgi:hypothetical protein
LRGEVALVEEKLGGCETGEGGLALDPLLEGAERLGAALAPGAGEGDVGMEGADLGFESAVGCGGGYAGGEGDEGGGGVDIGEEDAGAIEEAEVGEMDGDGRGVDLREAFDEADVLLISGVAEKLKGDVPGFGRHPSEVVAVRSEPGYDCGGFRDGRGGERDSYEQTHTEIV